MAQKTPKSVAEKIKELLANLAHVRRCAPAVRKLEAIAATIRLDTPAGVYPPYVTVPNNTYSLPVLGFRPKNGKEIAKVLRAMTDAGFQRIPYKLNTKGSQFITYRFVGAEITAILGERPDAVCKMVQVGERSYTMPVYELKCDPEVPAS
jgi:hypothetical protein